MSHFVKQMTTFAGGFSVVAVLLEFVAVELILLIEFSASCSSITEVPIEELSEASTTNATISAVPRYEPQLDAKLIPAPTSRNFRDFGIIKPGFKLFATDVVVVAAADDNGGEDEDDAVDDDNCR